MLTKFSFVFLFYRLVMPTFLLVKQLIYRYKNLVCILLFILANLPILTGLKTVYFIGFSTAIFVTSMKPNKLKGALFSSKMHTSCRWSTYASRVTCL